MNKQHVINTAKKMIKESGLINLSRAALCERAGLPNGSFKHITGCSFSEFVNDLKSETTDNDYNEVHKLRANPKLRRENILHAATKLAMQHGYHKITRDDVAVEAGVSPALVSRYFGSMDQLRTDIMKTAVKQKNIQLIAQGIANKDSNVRKINAKLKGQALQLIAEY